MSFKILPPPLSRRPSRRGPYRPAWAPRRIFAQVVDVYPAVIIAPPSALKEKTPLPEPCHQVSQETFAHNMGLMVRYFQKTDRTAQLDSIERCGMMLNRLAASVVEYMYQHRDHGCEDCSKDLASALLTVAASCEMVANHLGLFGARPVPAMMGHLGDKAGQG